MLAHSRLTLVLVPLALAAGALGGCGGWKEESENWRGQIQATTTSFQQSLDRAALAIPGERYVRLLEGLRSPDPAERKRWEDFVATFMPAKMVPYTLSLWMSYDEKLLPAGRVMEIHLDRAQSHTAADVRAVLETQSYHPTTPISYKRAAQTMDSLRAVIEARMDAALRDLFGWPTFLNRVAHQEANQFWYAKQVVWEGQPIPETTVFRGCGWTGALPQDIAGSGGGHAAIAWAAREDGRLQEKVQKALSAWHDVGSAILLPFSGFETDIGKSISVSIPFNPLDSLQWAFVAIPADLIDAQRPSKDFWIEVVVHEAGGPEKVLDPRGRYKFEIDEFYEENHTAAVQGGKQVRFAVHNMTGAVPWGKDLIARIDGIAAEIAAAQKR